MSRIEKSVDALTLLNGQLQRALKEDEPVIVEVNCVPTYFVPSFDPLIYNKFTRRNRAPHLTGKFALAGFMWTKDQVNDLIVPYSVLHASEGLQYGARTNPQFIIEAGEQVGIELRRT